MTTGGFEPCGSGELTGVDSGGKGAKDTGKHDCNKSLKEFCDGEQRTT